MDHQEQLWQPDRLSSETFALPDADIVLYRYFFAPSESDLLFAQLQQDIIWRQEYGTVYGKTMPSPRLTAWHGDRHASYTYSGITLNPEPWTPTLLTIKAKIEPLCHVQFNSVLLNFYRQGQDSVSWHSDNESTLGKNPVIASVSFGGTRRFSLRHRDRTDLKIVHLDLTHGSFLLMKGATQSHWQHQVPKTTKFVEPRINLTFRVIKE
jgi:alkylated DNA repair dioxygenase AlkB